MKYGAMYPRWQNRNKQWEMMQFRLSSLNFLLCATRHGTVRATAQAAGVASWKDSTTVASITFHTQSYSGNDTFQESKADLDHQSKSKLEQIIITSTIATNWLGKIVVRSRVHFGCTEKGQQNQFLHFVSVPIYRW
jgi:hypothetical protein